MTPLGHDRFCDEVVAQAGLLGDLLRDADLSLDVPTCPDWNLGQLARHVGGNLRSVETAVRTQEPVEADGAQVPDLAGPAGDDPAAVDAWLAEAAARFAGTLRAAGPARSAQVWGFRYPTAFWARRAAHDLVVHRADAAGALGADFAVDPELAADAVDEFLELMRGLQAAGANPRLDELAGRDGSIHLHATDIGQPMASEWLIELGPDGFGWRHGHERASVAVRGPVADVLRVLYRRLPADDPRVEVLGDAGLLHFWLERVILT